MNINIDKEELREMIDEKIESITDEMIKNRIQELLFGRLDSIFCNFIGFDNLIDRHVRENVEKQLGIINEDKLKKISDNIARDIAEKLRQTVVDSIGYRLCPYEEDDY